MRLLAVLLAVLLAAGCGSAPAAYESHYTPTTQAAYPPFDVATVNAALSTDQPYVISVLGDSTGDSPGEWVHLLSQRIAATYNRQVTIHDWDLTANAYGHDTVYGTGAPVTVWNASGAGKSAQWSILNFAAMVPGPVDLTVINHGHNDPKGAAKSVGELVGLAHKAGTGGVVVLLQNPRLDSPERAQLGVDAHQQISQEFSDPGKGAMVLDVYSAFPMDALAGMLRADRVHPNDAGQRIWTDAVAAGLQLR